LPIGPDYLNRRRHLISPQQEALPIVIEIAGTPNAGKDVFIDCLVEVLQNLQGFRVKVVNEAIASCPLGKDKEVDRLYYSVNKTINQLLEAVYDPNDESDFIIINRGLFDRLAFVHAYRTSKKITEEQERVLSNYILNPQWLHLTSFVYVLSVDANESLLRERNEIKTKIVSNVARQLSEQGLLQDEQLPTQRIVNPTNLQRLNAAYRYANSRFGHYFCTFSVPNATAEELARWLIKVVNMPIQLPLLQVSAT
jgi:hypothetical protein